jgi:hypothetical protein
MVSSEETIKCPFCAEEIKREAIYCRWCHRDIPTSAPKTSPWENLYDGDYKWRTTGEEQDTLSPQKKEKSLRFWVLIASGVIFLALLGFISSSQPFSFNFGSGSQSSETYSPKVSSLCKQVKLYSDNISEAFNAFDTSSRSSEDIENLVGNLRSLTSRIDSYRDVMPDTSNYDNAGKAEKLFFVLVGFANDTNYLADAIEQGSTSTLQTWFDSLNAGNAAYDTQCVLGN